MRYAALVTYLETFKPRCIAEGEDPITAHRYSAKVELAQHLLRMLKKDDDHDIEYERER